MGRKLYLTAKWGSWIAFSLLSGLIIAESCVPTGASGKQSFSFSQMLADIINFFTPEKTAVTLDPSGITTTTSSRTATLEDGTKVNLFENDEAIIGTTKLYNYTLTYPKEKADLYNSGVKMKFISTPGEKSYTYNFNSTSKGGTVRIIPLMEGDYTFTLTDASGHEARETFHAHPRGVTKDIQAEVDNFSLSAGEYAYFPFSLSFGDLSVEEGTSHYLERYFDPSLTPFSSSDESIFKVAPGGLIEGVGVGEAWLRYKEKDVCKVTVDGAYESKVASLEVSASKSGLSPLDYDYAYGAQIGVTYHDELGNALDVDEPLIYESEDELIAKVDRKGFVSGYRKQGETRVKVSLASDPEIFAYVPFISAPAKPESVTIKATSGGKAVPLTGGTLKAGTSISFSASYLPINTSDTRLHVDTMGYSNISVTNNDTNTPSLSLLSGGSVSFRVYSVGLGEASAVTYRLEVEAMQTIDDKDMTEFHQFIRKAAGHFSLFFVTGIFGTLAFILTVFEKRKWGIYAATGIAAVTGFALAGISELLQGIPALRRGSSFEDVMIDSVGFWIAAALTLGVCLLVRFILAHKKKKQETSGNKTAE
ncbi:MAG: VanZ family protein [Bacilli bacterium]|nr:VanZ family protein [Bacilli bacterium]